MKVMHKVYAGLVIMAGMFACSEDEIKVGSPESPVKVGLPEDMAVAETSGSVYLTVQLDRAATKHGTVYLAVPTGSDEHLKTGHDIVDGMIVIPIEKGQSTVEVTLSIVDDLINSGNLAFVFELAEVTDGFEIGNKSSIQITIIDDDIEPGEPENPGEFLGIPKSYETFAGNWWTKKTYEYNEAGLVSKVYWETKTPAYRSGTDTYYYNNNNKIESINTAPGFDTYFYYENGRVARSEKIEYGVVKSYSLYDYDPAGNLGGMVTYNLQENGLYTEGLTHLYLFLDNGNIYKHQIYAQDATSEGDYILLSTKTYDHYLSNENNFPMIEVIPGISMQPNLPTTFRLEENGHDIIYSMSYEFDARGYITKRSVSSSQGGEYTIYSWY